MYKSTLAEINSEENQWILDKYTVKEAQNSFPLLEKEIDLSWLFFAQKHFAYGALEIELLYAYFLAVAIYVGTAILLQAILLAFLPDSARIPTSFWTSLIAAIVFAGLNLGSDLLQCVGIAEADEMRKSKAVSGLSKKLDKLLENGKITQWGARFLYSAVIINKILAFLFGWLVGGSADALAVAYMTNDLIARIIVSIIVVPFATYLYIMTFNPKIENHILALVNWNEGWALINKEIIKGIEFLRRVIINALTRGVGFGFIAMSTAIEIFMAKEEDPMLATYVAFEILYNFYVTLISRTLPSYASILGNVEAKKAEIVELQTECKQSNSTLTLEEKTNLQLSRKQVIWNAFMASTFSAPISYFAVKGFEQNCGPYAYLIGGVIGLPFFIHNILARNMMGPEQAALKIIEKREKQVVLVEEGQPLILSCVTLDFPRRYDELKKDKWVQDIAFTFSRGGRAGRWLSNGGFISGLAKFFENNGWTAAWSPLDIFMLNLLLATLAFETDGPVFDEINTDVLAHHCVRAEWISAWGKLTNASTTSMINAFFHRTDDELIYMRTQAIENPIQRFSNEEDAMPKTFWWSCFFACNKPQQNLLEESHIVYSPITSKLVA